MGCPADPDQREQPDKGEEVVDRQRLTGWGQGVEIGAIQQPDAVGHDHQMPFALHLVDGPADSFDGQAQIIGNILPPHGQRHMIAAMPVDPRMCNCDFRGGAFERDTG